MIEYLWELWQSLWAYLAANFDPFRDTIDIALVALGIYWLLMIMRGTRAVQILVGLIVLVVANVAADLFNLITMRVILDKLSGPAVIIIVILFQHDIRRALARVGRGFFRSVADQQESQMLEEGHDGKEGDSIDAGQAEQLAPGKVQDGDAEDHKA